MAIAFDTAGHAEGTGSFTASVSLAAAAANEVAIIYVVFDSADTFSSLTVGGSSTGVTQVSVEYTGITNTKYRAYYLVNPPTSSSAYTITTTGTDGFPNIGVLIYSGVDTASPVDSSTTGFTATPLNLTDTVVATNCWLTSGAIAKTVSNLAAGTGTTIRAQQINNRAYGDSNGTVGTGSQTMQWTNTGGSAGGFLVAIKPSAAVASGRDGRSMSLLGVGN